ncbi:hypothetical protein RJ639_029689 [Escallonia herrerae]|uniref:Uncharacterized protein n=1 Tax=Escallonia herrerae TaxID=1293975 RepID=A0AA89BI15_9ASTE|nr:hypothetical protein RJ639_029689 [Escallonia herrerae]
MANPNAVVPYHDPYDDQISIIHQTLVPDEDTGLRAVADIPCMAEPNTNNPLLPQCDGGIADANDPLMDPFIWDLYNNSLLRVDVSEAGPAEIRGETDGQAGLNCDPQSNSNHGNPLRVSTWPLPEVPYSCSCCQVLREITHTNGTHIAKLEIHGRLGLICHAIFEKYDIGVTSQDHEYQIFRQESTRNVKAFLVQYCAERKQAGYIMLQDPLLIFYEALCVGCNSEDIMAIDDFLQLSPVGSGACQRNQLEAVSTEPENVTQQEAEQVRRRSTRSSLAAQQLLVNLVTDQRDFHPDSANIEEGMNRGKKGLGSALLSGLGKELLFFSSFGNKDMASAHTLVCVKQVKQEAQGEWDESMPLPGDIIEGVAKDAADELFIPAKARSELSSQLGRISRSQEAIWVKVRRGESAIKLRVCVVPDLSSKLQKRFTIRAASRDRHVAVLADLTFEQCTELQVYEARVHFDNQGNKKWMSLQFYRMLIGGISIGHAEMSRRMVNVDSKGFNQKGVKYDWKMKVGTYLPDQRSTVVNSVLFMPLASEHAIDATTVRTMAWFNAAVSSGIPLVFVNIQTEQIITSEKANSTGKEIIWGRQPNFTTTVQILQGIRLWFLPGIAEISLELIPVAGEARFGMDIKRTEELTMIPDNKMQGFICVYSVTKRTAAERAGLGHLFEQANKTGHLLVISRLEGKSLMPSTVSSAGLIHCCDHADIKETLISAMDQMDSIQLHIMSWPSEAPPNSVQAIGAARLRPPS